MSLSSTRRRKLIRRLKKVHGARWQQEYTEFVADKRAGEMRGACIKLGMQIWDETAPVTIAQWNYLLGTRDAVTPTNNQL